MRLFSILILMLCTADLAASTVEKFDAVSEEIYDWRSNYTAFGSYVTIVQDGQDVYTSFNGIADAEHQVPVSEDTVFDLASIAKTVTGYAIAELEESGKLSADDDIRIYLPDFPDYGHTITIAHLLHHTSGIKNWTSLLWDMRWPSSDRISTEQMLRLAYAQKDLDFVPGTRYQYSNSGYVLLAAIVEKVTGESFRAWTSTNIFVPLDMQNTFFRDEQRELIPDLAGAYSLNDSGEHTRIVNNTTVLGSSSLISNGTDMRKWMNFLMSPPAEKQAIVERMMTTRSLNDGGENTYAYGIDVGEYRGTKYITHSGSWASHTSQIVLLPDLNASVFVAHNFRTNTRYIANMYIDTLLPEEPETHEQESDNDSAADSEDPIELTEAQLERFVGVYRLGKAWIVKITRDADRLYTTANGEATFLMEPVAENQFLIRAYGNRTMTFNTGDDGTITSLTYNDSDAPKITFDDADRLDAFAEYEGVYFNVELELMLNFVLRDDALYANSIRHGNVKLISVEKDLFIGDGVIRSVKFSRDAAGNVIGFHVTNSRGENRTAFEKA